MSVKLSSWTAAIEGTQGIYRRLCLRAQPREDHKVVGWVEQWLAKVRRREFAQADARVGITHQHGQA